MPLTSPPPLLSLVIPLYNEADNVEPLLTAVRAALTGLRYEIIAVDDGSTDATVECFLTHAAEDTRLLVLSRNFGQTSAMAAGIDAATGEYIATLDGDLQNDPADIPLMLQKLVDSNVDMVVGRRANRQDGWFLRKFPSRIANWLIRKLTKVEVHDYGCTLKVFRAKTAKSLDLYGELHRFIPILAHMQGTRLLECDVRHHPRQHGVSKYGLGRTIRVLSDLMLMYFMQKYRQRPMHLFGSLGISLMLIGGTIEAYLLLLKCFGESIGTRPLFYVGILCIITGFQSITTGFMAELIMRTYYASQRKRPYLVGNIYHGTTRIENTDGTL
jgi:glycosyltransferase involved in cell wall biosynthesis